MQRDREFSKAITPLLPQLLSLEVASAPRTKKAKRIATCDSGPAADARARIANETEKSAKVVKFPRGCLDLRRAN